MKAGELAGVVLGGNEDCHLAHNADEALLCVNMTFVSFRAGCRQVLISCVSLYGRVALGQRHCLGLVEV
jgi:hypothetical protein